MKKGYWVVAYRSISNESAAKAYGELAVPAVQSFGGRFLTMSRSRATEIEYGRRRGCKLPADTGLPDTVGVYTSGSKGLDRAATRMVKVRSVRSVIGSDGFVTTNTKS